MLKPFEFLALAHRIKRTTPFSIAEAGVHYCQGRYGVTSFTLFPPPQLAAEPEYEEFQTTPLDLSLKSAPPDSDKKQASEHKHGQTAINKRGGFTLYSRHKTDKNDHAREEFQIHAVRGEHSANSSPLAVIIPLDQKPPGNKRRPDNVSPPGTVKSRFAGQRLKSRDKRAKPNACGQCDYTTDNKGHFKLHMRIHLDPGQRAKPNACGQCDYTTDNKGHFNQHMRTHLDPGQRAKLHACGSATTQPITRAISSSTCAPTPHPRGNSSYHRLDGYACGDYDQKMHRPYGLTILLSKVQIVCASNTMDSFLRTKFK